MVISGKALCCFPFALLPPNQRPFLSFFHPFVSASQHTGTVISSSTSLVFLFLLLHRCVFPSLRWSVSLLYSLHRAYLSIHPLSPSSLPFTPLLTFRSSCASPILLPLMTTLCGPKYHSHMRHSLFISTDG